MPVFVGIGHDADSTILDEVAMLNFSTPTKVAGFIHQHIMDAGLKTLKNWQYIQTETQHIQINQTLQLSQIFDQIQTNAQANVQVIQQKLAGFANVPFWVQQILYHQKQKLQTQIHQLGRARNAVQQQQTTLLKQQHQIQIQAKQTVFSKRSELQSYLPVIQSVAPLLKQQNRQLFDLQRRLLLQTENLVNQNQRMLLSIYVNIKSQAKKRLNEEKIRLKHSQALVSQSDPKSILKRGFALVSQQGEIIVKSADLQDSQPLSIRFHDGEKEINRHR